MEWDTQGEIILKNNSEGFCTIILFLHFSHRFCACGEKYKSCELLGGGTSSSQSPIVLPCISICNSTMPLASPEHCPAAPLCSRGNLGSLLLTVRSCCLIAAVWLMSNLFVTQKYLGFFLFVHTSTQNGQGEGKGKKKCRKISISIELLK